MDGKRLTAVKTRWSWLICLVVLGSMALMHRPADAQRPRRASVALEGYVGTAPAGVVTHANVVLQSGGKNYDFVVTRTVSETAGRSRHQLLRDARPHQNTLILRGTEAGMSTLTNAAPGQLLRISGTHRSGTHTLHVDRIEILPPGPTPTAAS